MGTTSIEVETTREVGGEDVTPQVGRQTALGPGLRVAGQASLASAAVAGVAVAFLLAMFAAFGVGATAAGETLGRINDVLILVAYALAVPGVLASAAILGSGRPGPVAIAAFVALAAIGAIVVLQWQLVTGSLTFEEQIGPVSVAFLALGGWFVISGYLGAGILPYGIGIGVLAALYVGYPVLAYRLGRSLVMTTATERPTSPHRWGPEA